MGSRALIIAPAAYRAGSGLDPHTEIARSAEKYGEVLSGDTACWGPDRVTVLPQDSLGTTIEVMDAIQAAADEAGREPDSTLLIVYIGHGFYWKDVPGGSEVHFAVNSSRRDAPFSWLSSWYVYRAIRNSGAARKVLIADCCHSNRLGQLGPQRVEEPDNDGLMHGVLREVYEGSCVLTAANEDPRVEALACTHRIVDSDFHECTPFSGHLLSVLKRGTKDDVDRLTVGMIRDAMTLDMNVCENHGNTLRMVLNNARERMPLFTNRTSAAERVSELRNPETAEKWVQMMLTESGYSLEPLLSDPEKAGRVVALLSASRKPFAPRLAGDVNRAADSKFAAQPGLFARYWNSVQTTSSLAA